MIRYTDFLVNEILPNGQVVHLTNLQPPRRQQAGQAKSAQAEAPVAEPAMTAVDAMQEEQVTGTDNVTKNKEPGTEMPKQISEEDQQVLREIFGEDRVNPILSLYKEVQKHPLRKPREFQPVTSDIIPGKDTRTKAHIEVRRIFESRLETTTADDETIKITPAPIQVKGRGGGGNQIQGSRMQGNTMRGKMGWQELGGEYLHFSLYKENKDTMEAIFFIASQLKVNMKNLQFGGTKDRRGVTVQRVSAYRIHAEQVAALNRRLRGSKVGDFAYHPTGLELGELGGNEFCITLRDCRFPGDDAMDTPTRVKAANAILSKSVADFQAGGFINYYGLQRFGSFATGTDAIGTKLLQGNLGGAVDDILSFSPTALAASQQDETSSSAASPSVLVSSDDKNRAAAINVWRTNGDLATALDRLPRKFSAETNIMRHLGSRDRRSGNQNRGSDFQGALMTIPRALRLMYVHAYQSLVWNVVAGHRWETHGSRVVQGDLVLVNEHRDKIASAAADTAEIDDQGEVIVRPADSDRANADSDYEQARALSAEEAASGLYNVFDVVLPLPGYDVTYPPNDVGAMYKTFMASERGGGLDPMDMRRNWKDISLSGGYRKMLGRPGPGMTFEVKTYADDLEQLVETDLQRLEKKGRRNGAQAEQGEHEGKSAVDDDVEEGQLANATTSLAGEKIAVIMRMRLAPSMYATMALRELMKSGGVKTYKPDYGGGR